MKKLIYRIEDKDGDGFYQTSNLDYWVRRDKFHLYKPRHVPPINDEGINRSSNTYEKCGFLNEAQLYAWIDKNKIRRLEKYGLKLVRLYREVTAIGEYQILFNVRP